MAADVVAQIDDDTEPAELCRIVLTALHEDPDTTDLKTLAKSSAFIRGFLAATAQATHVTELARLIRGTPETLDVRRRFVIAVHGALGHLRARGQDGGPDRDMPSTEAHMWVRELSRIDRYADSAARFRWADDGPPVASEDATQSGGSAFPAIHCRFCGRSGWGVELGPVWDQRCGPHGTSRRPGLHSRAWPLTHGTRYGGLLAMVGAG